MAPLLCTRCWSGNKLDRSTWSIRRKLRESCLRNRIDPTVVSLDKSRTISRGEGWGHCLYSAEFVRTIGRLNVAAMSTARSVPSRPSIEKWMAVTRMGDLLGCHSMEELNDHSGVEKPAMGHERL